jgi:cAMP-dependent protein kinase regulator
MYNSPRQATIRCLESGVLYGLDRSTFTDIVQEAAKKKRKHVNESISHVGILGDIEPYEK